MEITCKTKTDRFLISHNKNSEVIESVPQQNDQENGRGIRNENNVLKLLRLIISAFSGECSE